MHCPLVGNLCYSALREKEGEMKRWREGEEKGGREREEKISKKNERERKGEIERGTEDRKSVV